MNPATIDAVTYRKAMKAALTATTATEADMAKRTRAPHISGPRVALWAALHDAGYSLRSIGLAARRHHGVIMEALARYRALGPDQQNPIATAAYRAVEEAIRGSAPRGAGTTIAPPTQDGDTASGRRERILREMEVQHERRKMIQAESDRRGIW